MTRVELAVAIGAFAGTLWCPGPGRSMATTEQIVSGRGQTQSQTAPGLQLADASEKMVPLVIAQTTQTVSGYFEGCWEGLVGKHASCAPEPCDPGSWNPEEYKFCFRREANNVLRVDLASGSFCDRGDLLVEKIDDAAVTLTGNDAPTAGCSLARRYRVTLSHDWQTLLIHEEARLLPTASQSPLSPRTNYIFDAVFQRTHR